MDKNDLGAFEDIIDLIESELQSSEDDKTYSSAYADAEMNSFLEYEEQRLTKLDNLISRKMKNLAENPQLPRLIESEKEKRDETKASLIQSLIPADSGFNQEMDRMFRSMFGIFSKGQ